MDAADFSFSQRRAEYALSAAERMLLRDGRLPANPSAFGADGLLLETADGTDRVGSVPTEVSVTDNCSGVAHEVVHGDQRWVQACYQLSGERRLVAVVRHTPELARNLAFLIGALALIVGLLTALGVLRILAPLSSISAALERVRLGEHGVRVQRVGMRELDELTDGLNAAATAMEEREDAIRGRIAVVHELARMVAHEVRNPLQSVELLTSLIAAEPKPEERRVLMRAIQSEIRILDAVVTRLLREGIDNAGFRLNRTERAVIEIVDQIVALRTPEAHRAGVLIETELQPHVMASVDSALFARSIENLVSNALQAVPDGNGRVRITLRADSDQLTIVVEDNGPGVPPQLADTVFDPHVTGRAEGHGLGLSMVREVIRAHGGTVAHSTSSLGGAAFTVSVPLQEGLS
ncbi:MAG: HAMP domain-containing histidine kinase [Proteobacteria bacterium]|nr:HAMP domain-containing histidine kinase [Pseudomonadota bacterium]